MRRIREFNTVDCVPNHLEKDTYKQSAIAAFAAFLTAIQYLGTVGGKLTPIGDVTNAWRPFMDAVLNEGIAPYTVSPALDNKPPLFQYLNLFSGSVGDYITTFYLIIALSNILSAVLLYRWIRDRNTGISGSDVALIGALIYVALLPSFAGTMINARSPMLFFLLLSLNLKAPSLKGAAVAAAVLCSQWAIFMAPAIGFRIYYREDSGYRKASYYTLSGILTAVLIYSPLYIIWGWDSVVGGVMTGIFSRHWILSHHQAGNILYSPKAYFDLFSRLVKPAIFLFPFILIYLLKATASRNEFDWEMVGLLAVGALPLAVKSLGYYFLHPLPFAAVIAAAGIQSLTTSDSWGGGELARRTPHGSPE